MNIVIWLILAMVFIIATYYLIAYIVYPADIEVDPVTNKTYTKPPTVEYEYKSDEKPVKPLPKKTRQKKTVKKKKK